MKLSNSPCLTTGAHQASKQQLSEGFSSKLTPGVKGRTWALIQGSPSFCPLYKPCDIDHSIDSLCTVTPQHPPCVAYLSDSWLTPWVCGRVVTLCREQTFGEFRLGPELSGQDRRIIVAIFHWLFCSEGHKGWGIGRIAQWSELKVNSQDNMSEAMVASPVKA